MSLFFYFYVIINIEVFFLKLNMWMSPIEVSTKPGDVEPVTWLNSQFICVYNFTSTDTFFFFTK